MTGRRPPRWQSLLPFPMLFFSGCTVLTAVDVDYPSCVAAPDGQSSETFTGGLQAATDRCWRIGSTPEGTKVFTADGDLVVRPLPSAVWSDRAEGPSLFQPMTADFLLVARAEAVSTESNLCLSGKRAAGLFLRRAEPLGWTTLLVSPDLAGVDAARCAAEDVEVEARVSVASHGFEVALATATDDVGRDAEAIVAICRLGSRVSFYYFTAPLTASGLPRWVELANHAVDAGPLDVGLTAIGDNGDPSRAANSEGHFPWAVLIDFSGSAVPDGCQGALAEFLPPETE